MPSSATIQPKPPGPGSACAPSCNIARHLSAQAASAPDRSALVVAAADGSYARWSFAELDQLSNRYANALARAGIERGTRTLMLVPHGIEFVGLTFALLKLGAVPVLIDPGMGLQRLLTCAQQAEPEAMIGIPKAQVVRLLRKRLFPQVRTVVTVGRRWGWGGYTLRELVAGASSEAPPAVGAAHETAAILFTSGATGAPKGVVFTHGVFDAQVRLIRDRYGIAPGEVDLATFPLFALFDPGMGVTCVIPRMNPTRPASAEPALILRAIRDQQATSSFGSPALWDRVSAYCIAHGETLQPLKRVLIAGAPVAGRIVEQLRLVLPEGADVHTPYGATESLPVASISGSEVLAGCLAASRAAKGTCVGTTFPEVTARVIRITDDAIPEWSDDLVMPDGEPGEITVAGPMVTHEYYGRPEATAVAKIRDGERVWHRIGDIGYRDGEGRLWFCGRKAHRVQTAHGVRFSVQCEGVFHAHPRVHRCALVGVGPIGRQTPVLVVEPAEGDWPRGRGAEQLRAELRELARRQPVTADVERFLFCRALPVDVRHNAKIDREALARWAARRCG